MKRKSTKHNLIMNFILTSSAILFPIITFPYVSRILLPEYLGKVSFASSIISYFSMIAMLGIPTYGIRVCAKHRDNKTDLSRTVHELLIINIIMTALTYIFLIISIITIERFTAESTLLMIFSVSMILNMIGVSWLFIALEQYDYITIRSLIFKVLAVIFMFLYIKQPSDYLLYAGLTIFASGASNIVNFFYMRKFITFKSVGNYNLRQHLKPIFVFFAMSVATSVYLNLDTVMLGFMKDDTEVGLYTAAVKIKSVLTTFITSLGTVLLPRMSNLVKIGEMDEFKNLTAKALNFVILISIPISIFFMVYAEESIMILSGQKYLGATNALIVITPSIILIGITNILGIQVLVPLNQEKFVLYSVIFGAIADLILNLIFIPLFGATGAALGTLIAEGAVLIAQIIFLRKFLGEIKTKLRYRYVIVASIVACASIYLFNFVSLHNIVIDLMLYSVGFFGVYGLCLLLMREPLVLDTIRSIINKFRRDHLDNV